MVSKGFSLIEIMVAITVMAFMTLGVYSLTDNAQRTRETIIPEDREYLQVYAAFARIKNDIEQLWSPLYFASTDQTPPSRPGSTPAPENQAPKNVPRLGHLFPKATVQNYLIPLIESENASTITFFTGSYMRRIQDQKAGRFAWIHYSLEAQEAREDEQENSSAATLYQLMRKLKATDPYTDEKDIEEAKGSVLMRGVKSLAFHFWDSQDKEWKTSLKEISSLDQMALRGIKVVIEWQGRSQQEFTHTRVFRSNWPYFDAIADEKERQKAMQAKKTPNTNRRGSSRRR